MSSNRIRRVMASAIAAGMLFAIVPAATFAQDEGSSIIPAGLNADRIDGIHAVGAKAAKSKRARKLVATDNKGFLPSNIVKPKWGYIKNKPAAFRDGRITWAEVVGKPADNVGVAQVAITILSAQAGVVDGDHINLDVPCPVGTKVIAGGFAQSAADLIITDSYADPTGNFFRVWARNLTELDGGVSGATEDLFADATCLGTPGVAIATKGGFKPSSRRK